MTENSASIRLSPLRRHSACSRDHHYDAIVSDYQMPGMNGIEFLQHIRHSGNTLPFIIFTGKGREEVVIEAINSGADSYLQKGGNPQSQFAELALKIQQIVRRSRAERALREAEARYRAIFQNASDIIRVLDRDCKIAYDSPSSSKILGYPAGSLMGKTRWSMSILMTENVSPPTLRLVYKNKSHGVPSEFRIRKADGNYIWVESVAANLIGVEGVDGVVATTRPITERKKAEEALKKKHEELNAAFERLTVTEEELRQNYDDLAKSERRLAESEHNDPGLGIVPEMRDHRCPEGIVAFDANLRCHPLESIHGRSDRDTRGEVMGKQLESESFPSSK